MTGLTGSFLFGLNKIKFANYSETQTEKKILFYLSLIGYQSCLCSISNFLFLSVSSIFPFVLLFINIPVPPVSQISYFPLKLRYNLDESGARLNRQCCLHYIITLSPCSPGWRKVAGGGSAPIVRIIRWHCCRSHSESQSSMCPVWAQLKGPTPEKNNIIRDGGRQYKKNDN